MKKRFLSVILIFSFPVFSGDEIGGGGGGSIKITQGIHWNSHLDDHGNIQGLSGKWEIPRDEIWDVYKSLQDDEVLVFDANGKRIHIPKYSEAPQWGANANEDGHYWTANSIRGQTFNVVIDGQKFDAQDFNHFTTDEKINLIDNSDAVIIFFDKEMRVDEGDFLDLR